MHSSLPSYSKHVAVLLFDGFAYSRWPAGGALVQHERLAAPTNTQFVHGIEPRHDRVIFIT